MYLFLIPLVIGFGFNLASAFTATFSRRWGERRGTLVSAVLRDVLGIPVWATGFALAARAPSPALFTSTPAVQAIGWLAVAAGGAVILVALVTIRTRAALPSVRDSLARSGIYAHVRHPIHTGTLLELVGLLLMPTQTAAVACALGAGWVVAQTRLEELDLLQRLPRYRAYMDEAPRFFPRPRAK